MAVSGMLLDLAAPGQLRSLARLEHGRTIPLADIGSTTRSTPSISVNNQARSEDLTASR
jgi:hypothetical protein